MSSRVLWVLFLITSCGLAQTTFEANHTGWVPPGTYAAPDQLLIVTTPSTTFENVATPWMSLGPVFLQAGASNSTEGLTAGASNATNGEGLAGSAQFAAQNWYGPAVVAPSPELTAPEQETESGESVQPNTGFEFGIAQFEFSRGAQRVMRKPPSHANRVFTDADVARLNDSNGRVRFGGKTEHLD